MKKCLSIFLFVSLTTIIACGPSSEQTKAEKEKAKADSIAKVQTENLSIAKLKMDRACAYVLQIEKKIITKKEYDSLTIPLKAEQDSLRALLTPAQIKELDEYYLTKIEKKKTDSIADIEAAAEQKVWDNSAPGRIQKLHPSWSREDCEKISKRKVWIGMSLDMVKAERGNPNTINPSNYGSGNEYQWCWDDYTPSCFYGGEDGIITSYN
jgi:hypothetical protein